jgi:hypothetical protein
MFKGRFKSIAILAFVDPNPVAAGMAKAHGKIRAHVRESSGGESSRGGLWDPIPPIRRHRPRKTADARRPQQGLRKSHLLSKHNLKNHSPASHWDGLQLCDPGCPQWNSPSARHRTFVAAFSILQPETRVFPTNFSPAKKVSKFQVRFVRSPAMSVVRRLFLRTVQHAKTLPRLADHIP